MRWTRGLPLALFLVVIGPTLSFGMLDRVAAQDVSQRLALSVMLTKMANLQGGIYTQYQSVPSPGEGLAAGHEILLQNNSLLMLYAAQVGDRQLFDQQLRVIEEHFLQGQIGLLYWKLDDQMQPASSSWGTYSNAPGDSLRVINALLTANDLWAEKSYQELAIKLGEGLKSHSIASDQTLRYYASWTPQLEPAGYGDRTVLAQLDFLAMARLAQQDKSWEGILVTCLEIALSGMTKHGLFNLSCLPEQKQYEKGDGSMIQMAQVAYHLAVYGRSLRDPAATDAAQQFLRFVEAEYGTEGKICSRYDPETGLPLTTWENVAVYALIASVFMELDNYPFAERIISERILPSQQLDDTSPVYGAFTTRSDDAYALDTLEVLLALAGSEGSKTVVEEGRIRAVWYLSFQKDGYLQTNVPSDLRRIRASLCPNYIGLFAIAYQDKKTSSDPHRDPTRTASDESLRRAISQIHRMGMGVVLLTPLFPDDGTWEGAIMPEDVQTWFEHWREILLHYATLAEETGVEVLLLGSELLTLDSQTDEWNKLILAIRSCYHGKLSYGVNFWASRKAYQRVREMNQWRHLDYIGVTGYFELTSKANPSLKELEAAWHHDRNEQDVIADLEKLSNEYGKTIVFWEIGYFSRAGTNTYPWNYPRPSEVDEKEQADCWDAFLKVVRENEWFKGYGIYAEQVGLPANPPGYSVLGKLAEKVLRAACSR